MGGKPAYVSYISPSQVNILTPAGISIGDVDVQTRSGALVSSIVTVRSEVVSPAFFQQGAKYTRATHVDGSLVDPKKPAQPDETIFLYGNGFGGTDPSVIEGTVVTSPAAIIHPVDIRIGGRPAEISYRALVDTGLYVFLVKVPAQLATGDATVVAQSD